MTLESYDSHDFDRMSLRLLDLCARLRNLSRQSREEQLPPVELHDKKALEWLEKLEDWMFRAENELTRAAHKARGQRLAKSARSPAEMI